MKKILTSLLIFLLSLPLYLQSEIDIYKEMSKIYEEHDEDFLDNGCDAVLHTLVSINIHLAYVKKYFREIKAQQTYAFCGDEQMVDTYTPPDEVLMDFVSDVLIEFNDAVPKDVKSCGSNRHVEKRIKELFFEPNAFRAFFNSTYNHIRNYSVSTKTTPIDIIFSPGEKAKACKAVYKNPEFTMPPSWLD
ncbi:hypothetical protein N9D96_02405 [Gammaproteobacteria bacterium]|jgi:hypothetical protein|nr:hypothetical protein [Gammaproteobacteria bacterium]